MWLRVIWIVGIHLSVVMDIQPLLADDVFGIVISVLEFRHLFSSPEYEKEPENQKGGTSSMGNEYLQHQDPAYTDQFRGGFGGPFGGFGGPFGGFGRPF
jgi:hypothetical protein